MPTYDYVCGQCGHRLEIFHSITASAKRKCPACGKNKLQRRIGAGAGILFKGSGFYQTDYRSAAYEASAKGDKEASGEPTGAESGAKKGDAKGAAKEAAKEAPEAGPKPPKPDGGGKSRDSKKKAG